MRGLRRHRSTYQRPLCDLQGDRACEKEKTLEVNIPAGVETGVRMRLAGEGEAGLRGGEPGDLYVLSPLKKISFCAP